VLRQWIQEIFDFRLVPALTEPEIHLQFQSAIKNQKSKISSVLSLRKLEAFPSTLLSVLLPFLDTRVAGHKTCLFQRRTKVRIVFKQSASYPMPDRTGLPGGAATLYVNQ
jgi:hypothetical protein